MRRASLSLLLSATLTACLGFSSSPEGSNGCASYDAPSFESGPEFSGSNAFGHVLELSCDFSKKPPREQPRIPDTPGHARSVEYLESTLRQAGWDTRLQTFTGEDYLRLDHGSVASWVRDCDEPNRSRVAGLTFHNVVAERGSGPDLYILMAHFDGKRFASQDSDPAKRTQPVLGANDGASGVAVWLEAARFLESSTSSTQWRILLVDGEDGFEDCHPLAGSLYHARTLLSGERDRLQGVILLDMVGDPDAQFCYSTNSSPLRDRLVNAARRLNVAALSTSRGCSIVDDHTSFADLGFSAVDLIDYRSTGFPPYWHTTSDTPEKLTPQRLGEVGRVVVEALRDLVR